jgi:hypothetical protein
MCAGNSGDQQKSRGVIKKEEYKQGVKLMKSSQEAVSSYDRSTARYISHAFQSLGLKTQILPAQDKSIKVLIDLNEAEMLRVLIYPPGQQNKTKMSVSRLKDEGEASQQTLARQEFFGLYAKSISPKVFLKSMTAELTAIAAIAQVDHAALVKSIESIPEEGLPVVLKKNGRGIFVADYDAPQPSM